MNRFLTRILVCLVPTILSIGVVAWAFFQYNHGRGGFRLGVDLVGGTILVYEVDETKMPDNFKAEDLAAALKRRIDPADLYNITIRPVPGNPPRVEIILPTGGKHQATAEQSNWESLLAKAYEDFRGNAEENPYADIKKGGEGGGVPALRDAIADNNPDVSPERITDWIEKNALSSSKGKRLLTSEEVQNIKNLIEKQGRLEFRILANKEDDSDAINAARDYLKNPKNKAELERLEVRADPPLPPRREDGGLTFPVTLPGVSDEPPHSYSWVELGKSELHSLKINSDALKANPIYSAEIETALAKGEPFTLQTAGLFYVRRITDWTRRSSQIKDRDLGKKLEYFALVRDPLKGQEITGDYLVSASPGVAHGERAIDFRFNSEGGNLFYDITTKNKPSGPKVGGFRRHLAIIFDGQILSAPSLNEADSHPGPDQRCLHAAGSR